MFNDRASFSMCSYYSHTIVLNAICICTLQEHHGTSQAIRVNADDVDKAKLALLVNSQIEHVRAVSNRTFGNTDGATIYIFANPVHTSWF